MPNKDYLPRHRGSTILKTIGARNILHLTADQEIDGNAFLNMKETDFEKMQIRKLGVIIKLRTAVDCLRDLFLRIPIIDDLVDLDASFIDNDSPILKRAKTNAESDNDEKNELGENKDIGIESNESNAQNKNDNKTIENKNDQNDDEIADEKNYENQANNNKKIFCRCKREVKERVEKINVPIRQFIRELDVAHKRKNKYETMLDKNLELPHDEKLDISKFMCDKMISLWGNNYPPHCLKAKFAKALIMEFPSLKSTETKHAEGHEHFTYGMFENRLKYIIHSSLPDTAKKNVRRKGTILPIINTPSLSDDDLFEMKVLKLQTLRVIDGNKKEIIDLMKETQDERIKKYGGYSEGGETHSVNTILRRFPKLMEYEGELINLDFAKVFNDAEFSLEESFANKYTEAILKYCKKYYPTTLDQLSNFTDDKLKAISILPYLLSEQQESAEKKRVRKRKNVDTNDFPPADLIRFIPMKEDILETHIKSKNKLKPFLICKVQEPHLRSGQFYLRADRRCMILGTDFMKSFAMYCKFCMLFKINMVPELADLFNFMLYIEKFADPTFRVAELIKMLK